MAEQRSVQAYEHWRDASQRFDYFLMGTTGARCAFIAQSWIPKKLSFSPSTAELFALLLLAASVAAGLKRAQHAIHAFGLAHNMLHLSEDRGELAANFSGAPLLNRLSGDVLSAEYAAEFIRLSGKYIPRLERATEESCEAAGRWAGIRNWLLALGFLLLLTASASLRLWGPSRLCASEVRSSLVNRDWTPSAAID